MSAITTRFMKRFQGLTRAYGVYALTGKRSARGKVEGKAKTVKRPLTERIYDDHLAGRISLGVVPINDEGLTLFGAIDVDVYDLNHIEFEAKVREKEIPLILCRTKSGGAHLYYFLKELAPAKAVRERLKKYAIALGYPQAEVFPKQDRIEKEDDVGSWINLPYFGESRKAIHEGRELTAEEFLDRADFMTNIEPDDFEGGPPCLRSLVLREIKEGERNQAAFAICVYLRKRHGEGWQKDARHLIPKHIPSLDRAEVQTVINSARNKQYFYRCKEEPLTSLCDKESCREAEHGIQGSRNDPGIRMENLKRITTPEPSFELMVNGKRLKLESIEDLTSQHRFGNTCAKRLGIFPRVISRDNWRLLVQGLLDNWEDIAAPEDSGDEGQFMAYFSKFISDRALARHQDELLTGKAWINEGEICFQSRDMIEYMKKKNFKTDGKKAWNYLRDRGASAKQISLKGQKIRVWVLPADMRNPVTKPLDVPEVVDEGEKAGF